MFSQKFVFIGAKSGTSSKSGKDYRIVTLHDSDKELNYEFFVMSEGTISQVDELKKFKAYTFIFELGNYNNKVSVDLKGTEEQMNIVHKD